MKKRKKGQITIFIITGIILIAGIGLFFFFRGGVIPTATNTNPTDTSAFLSTCIEDKVSDAVHILSYQGGDFDNPLNKNFQFEGEEAKKISYLCYVEKKGEFCVNQRASLISHLENEIKSYIKSDVEGCFNELGNSLTKQGYDIEKSYKGFEVNLAPGKIEVKIIGSLDLTKADSTESKREFVALVPSKLYDLGLVATDIINYESSECDFAKQSYMMLNPEYDIQLFKDDVGEKIYTIKYRDTSDIFRFAVRGCIL